MRAVLKDRSWPAATHNRRATTQKSKLPQDVMTAFVLQLWGVLPAGWTCCLSFCGECENKTT